MPESNERSDPEHGADPVEATLRALAKRRRRDILSELEGSEGTTTDVEELLDRTAPADAERRERRRVELHHTDLPILDDTGLVDYDPDNHTVRYTPTENLERWLDHAAEQTEE